MKLEICLHILAKSKVEFSEIQSQTLRDNKRKKSIFRSFKDFHCNLTFLNVCLLWYILFKIFFLKHAKNICMDKLSFFFFSSTDSWQSSFLFSFAEQRRLKKTDIPLLHRLIQGPSKKNARIFLMDKDTEEISSDV